MTLRLYVWQRLTAAVMVPLIIIHIATIFLATSNGLSAADMLARTQGSLLWGSFYSAFVLMAAIHGAIGLRSVLTDWTDMGARGRDLAMWSFGLFLLTLGLRAVAAMVIA